MIRREGGGQREMLCKGKRGRKERRVCREKVEQAMIRKAEPQAQPRATRLSLQGRRPQVLGSLQRMI